MSNRKSFIDYIKNGGNNFICSPQIGAGAGFDTKMAGKTWMTDTTVEDTKKACQHFDMIPLYNFGLPDLSELVEGFHYESKNSFDKEKQRKISETTFVTPKGNLTSSMIEEELKGCVITKYFITEESELDILDYYLDALNEQTDFSFITRHVQQMREMLGEDEAMDIQWAMQPYELLCFPDTMNTAIFAIELEDRFFRFMDKILELNKKIIPAVAKGGADFVFLGGPGSEMISPQYYEDFLVPYSKEVSRIVHDNGLLIYSHICSPIEPMLTKGYYNEMGIDLFETLSGPPVGNVKSMEDAFSKLDSSLCTRGNIGLDALLMNSPEEIYEKSMRILEAAKKMGRKHMLAASDYMFYDTKVENVEAMCRAVRDFNKEA